VPDQENCVKKFYKTHRGAIIGTGLGLLVGALILTIGFFETLFLAICAGIGAFFGTNTRAKKRFREFLDRILPDLFRDK
jgi:uncharacterized membrane protein